MTQGLQNVASERLPDLSDVRLELLRRDPSRIFQYAGLTPDAWQRDWLTNPPREGALNCSRQIGKSTFAGGLATNVITLKPESLVLAVSKSLRQSGELFRKIKRFYHMAGDLVSITSETALTLELSNGSRVVTLPGSEETIRSFSAVDLILLDEASRIPDELYYAVRPMLAVSHGSIIILSTPFGKRGFFFKEWVEGGDSWRRLSVPATECSRLTPEFLTSERKRMGDWWFRQEYMCEFVETDDSPFTYEQIQGMLSDDVDPLFEEEGWL